MPQEIAERHDRLHGIVIASVAHQPSDGVQRVEHEVRLDLPAQRLELRARELLAQLCCLGLLARHALPAVEREIDRENEGVQQQTGQQPAVVELGEEQRSKSGLMGVSPRIEQHLECRAPCGSDDSDAHGSPEVQRPSREAVRPGQWVPMSEPDHHGCHQNPGQPVEHQRDEEADPVVMHPLGTHREYRFAGVDQPNAGPDREDPGPVRRASLGSGGVHAGIVLRESSAGAAPCSDSPSDCSERCGWAAGAQAIVRHGHYRRTS